MPSGFGGRGGSDVNTSHVFPQGILVAISLIGSGEGDEGARVGAIYETRLPFCSVGITVLLSVV